MTKIKFAFLFTFTLVISFSAVKIVLADEVATSTSSTITSSTTTPINNLASLTPSTSSGSSTQGSVLGLQAPPVAPIIAAIKNAKELLGSVTLNHQLLPVYKKNTKKLLRYNLGSKDIALAILAPLTNTTTITIGRLNAKSMVFPDPAVNVELVKFNGVNSKFQVNSPTGGKVVALKYLISKTESGSKKNIENGLSEAIYVPYSSDFGQPDVLTYGASYLDGVINKVTADLKYLPSYSVPGKTLTDAISPALIKALVYAEHTDTTQVLYGGNTQGTIDQLNILFALNEGDTYKYSVSTAGARGISQFIPSTYSGLVKRHPEAGLMPDFIQGMSDHVNAIKATYLLLDDYAGTVRVKAANGFAEGHIFEYGAASYNGGTTRVAKAVNSFGTEWNMDHSGEVNAVLGQVANFKSQVASLKAKVKKTSDKKQKSELNSQLASAQTQLVEATNKLSNIKTSSLRNETVNYLNKIYKVIQFFNNQQLAIN